MKTIIVWYRNDLRVHDHPALFQAADEADRVVPAFIFDPAVYTGRHSSANRNRFLLECLEDLKTSLIKSGANLIVREGKPEHELKKLAQETGARGVYYTADYTPLAIRRDKRVHQALEANNVHIRSFPGRLIISTPDKITTKAGEPHRVFTPFYKVWLEVGRRQIVEPPKKLLLPEGITPGILLALDWLGGNGELSPDVTKGGESAALKRLDDFLDGPINNYRDAHNDLSADGTSRLSPYFHFGCLSPLYAESRLSYSQGAQSWRRQLAWRDFYHNMIFRNPTNSTQEFQEKYRELKWGNDVALLTAWQNGMTGYPAVDAAMRQLKKEGWVHNRGRLIVGSFLTKDLWLDWQLGESYFMHMLIDGDQSNNNGNWQWIASVGVDPEPVYRRLYNPASQRDKFDPSGAYVRRFVPELKNVPDKYLSEPWTMSEDIQKNAGCVIGQDYPAPIVDHKIARLAALEQYRSV